MIEKIVDALAEESQDSEHQSLKSCALVCHSFLSPCRKRIFASITLNAEDQYTPQPRSPNTRELHSLLAHSPEIGNYIRKIRYNVDYGTDTPANSAQAMDQPDNFPLLIPRLISVHILYPCRIHEDQFSWDLFSARRSLQHLLRIPTLTHLKLHGIQGFPLIELLSCEGLKGLDIDWFHFSTDRTELKTPSTPIKLMSFSAGYKTTKALTRLLGLKTVSGKHLIDFSGVQELSLTSQGTNDVHNAQELFSRCKCLTSVTMISRDLMLTLSEFGNRIKQSLRTIRSLRFDFMVNMLAPGSNDCVLGLTRTLEEMSNKNIIETISIQIFIITHTDHGQGEGWAQLDRALASTPSAWPKLKAVSLSIKLDALFGLDSDVERAFERLPETQFRGLSTNESILFAFKVTRFQL